VLPAVSPSGDRFLTGTLYQETLAAHRATDGSVLAEADAETEVARYADTRFMHQEVFWDHSAGFLDEDTVITGTVQSDILAGARAAATGCWTRRG
jgi:hypothetical protein